jgi:plasmid maintenance system killer protein
MDVRLLPPCRNPGTSAHGRAAGVERQGGCFSSAASPRGRPARIFPTARCQPGTPTPGSGLRVRSYSRRRGALCENFLRSKSSLSCTPKLNSGRQFGKDFYCPLNRSAGSLSHDMLQFLRVIRSFRHRGLRELRGRLTRYSVRVSANWRLTFAWEESDATQVDLEDYH